MAERVSKQTRREIKYLSTMGLNINSINELLGTHVSRTTFYSISRQEEFSFSDEELKELEVKFSNPSTPVEVAEVSSTEKHNSELIRLFDISLEELLDTSEENIKEKRDLILIAQEFERLFDIPIDDNIVYSFQEKYQALVNRGQDAVKIFIDKIRFVYRKSETEIHRWKFRDSEGNINKDKVIGHIVNLIKSELDGTSYRALSETQHKTVAIFKNIINVKGDLTSEGEHKLLSLLTSYNAFDLINTCIEVSRINNPEVDFLNKVEAKLSRR